MVEADGRGELGDVLAADPKVIQLVAGVFAQLAADGGVGEMRVTTLAGCVDPAADTELLSRRWTSRNSSMDTEPSPTYRVSLLVRAALPSAS